MLSGLVFFEEIVENVKDRTGIENLRPFYDRIRRFIFNAERDIAAGGLIVRKKKLMTNGDGFYDGTNIIMPADFIGEYSYGDLSSGTLNGNILTLNCDGPDEIEIKYMGFLLDNNGNPITTRNHMEAVIAHCIFRLYSPQYFLRQGNRNQYQDYKTEYEDEVMNARGHDAFPTEEEWIEIGKTMNGGAFEAFTDCGMMYIDLSCNETYIVDGSSSTSETAIECDCDFVEVFEASLMDQPPEDLSFLAFTSSITGTSTLTGLLTEA